MYALDQSVKVSGKELHPRNSLGDMMGPMLCSSTPAFTEVTKCTSKCSCHSMKYLSYQNLVNITHTESEAKAIQVSLLTNRID